jgi:uncharacterized protein involved in exopolysaccharide biosynthesis/Mrp family chromosome partitioning ATPase
LDAFSDEHRRSQLLAAQEIRQLEAAARIARAAEPVDGAEAIKRIFNTLQRRRRVIVYTVAAGGILALLASIIFGPSYLATAQLIIDLQRPDISNQGMTGAPIAVSQVAEDSAIDTHITTLTSDANLRQALQALGSLDEKDVGRADKPAILKENAALTRLRRGLKVGQERRSRIISVGYNDRDPNQAAQIANAVARVYVNSLRREKRDTAALAVSRFSQRLGDVRDEVARAETEMHTFRQVHVANEAAGPDQTEQQITQTARQLALLRSDTDAGQKRLDEFRNLRRGGGSILDLAKVLDSPRLTELANIAARKLRGRSDAADPPLPDLLRAIDNEIVASTSRLELEQRTYQSQIQSIESRLELLRHAAAEATDDTIGLRALERKASALGQLYESLLRERQDLIERGKLAEPDIRILALAEPPIHPTSFNRLFLIPPALVAFILFGCMISLTLDRLDHTLRGERETAEALHIPCAGLVPRLMPREAHSIPHLLREHPGAPYSKAVRSIFTGSVPIFRNGPEHKIFVITSSIPGEGKTTLAWSLALLAAQLQWKVLVLEAGGQASPLRTQAMSLLEFRSPVATLTDVMAKRSPIASAAGSIGRSCISFLPFGSENKLLPVLANPGFASLIEQVRDTYDLVIVDAPSIFDSSEVRLLVSKADKILFAVRWGTTPRETAVSAIQLIQSADQYDPNDPNKIVSVLTDVDLRQHARYRFADHGDFLSKPKS